jgi:hypothetical protein
MASNAQGELNMPTPKREALAEVLQYGPTRFPIYDPGPPWWFDVVSKETQLEVIAIQLQFEKELLTAQSNALDRQIALLARSKS